MLKRNKLRRRSKSVSDKKKRRQGSRWKHNAKPKRLLKSKNKKLNRRNRLHNPKLLKKTTKMKVLIKKLISRMRNQWEEASQ